MAKGVEDRWWRDHWPRIALEWGKPSKRCDADYCSAAPRAPSAGSQRIERELGWRPRFSSLDVVVESAWTWKQKFPLGYEKSV